MQLEAINVFCDLVHFRSFSNGPDRRAAVALRRGYRGLPRGDSLTRLLQRERAADRDGGTFRFGSVGGDVPPE